MEHHLADVGACFEALLAHQLDKIKNIHAEVQHGALTGQRHSSV